MLPNSSETVTEKKVYEYEMSAPEVLYGEQINYLLQKRSEVQIENQIMILGISIQGICRLIFLTKVLFALFILTHVQK